MSLSFGGPNCFLVMGDHDTDIGEFLKRNTAYSCRGDAEERGAGKRSERKSVSLDNWQEKSPTKRTQRSGVQVVHLSKASTENPQGAGMGFSLGDAHWWVNNVTGLN
ncbi:unnamed protein product [Calypogeia fissa]